MKPRKYVYCPSSLPYSIFNILIILQRAGVLFFVLDNQTRSTAAMIEVAYALGKGQQLVLVINKYSWPGAKIAGEEITFRLV